jgi:hypothetical protein
MSFSIAVSSRFSASPAACSALVAQDPGEAEVEGDSRDLVSKLAPPMWRRAGDDRDRQVIWPRRIEVRSGTPLLIRSLFHSTV